MGNKALLNAALLGLALDAGAAELLKNWDFDICSSGTVPSYWTQTGIYGDAYCYMQNSEWGTDLFMKSTASSSSDAWDFQLVQKGLTVRPNRRYVIAFGGNALGGASRYVSLGVQNASELTDYKTYMEGSFYLSSTYSDFTVEDGTALVWDNCSVSDANVQFFINGGASSADFKIAWVNFYESDDPIDCGGSSSSMAYSSPAVSSSIQASSSSKALSSSSLVSSSSYTLPSSSTSTISDGVVAANQVSYGLGMAKSLALLMGNAEPLRFVKDGELKLSVDPGASEYWAESGEYVRQVDFSALEEAGSYTVYQGSSVLYDNLRVGEAPYKDLLRGLLRFYYYQRASLDLQSPYAEASYARAAGHKGQYYPLHSSTGESGSVYLEKGWYDAGDYGRYIVNSGITTSTLLSLYLHYPSYTAGLDLGIPGEGNLSPLLAEIKWNLDWMLGMQAGDGGVYHKLTATNFNYSGMPSGDPSAFYVVGKSTAASLDFAATLAMASRAFASVDASYADSCLEAAKKAYAWASAHTDELFTGNPSGILTGTYADSQVGDEFYFAEAELALATGGMESLIYLKAMSTRALSQGAEAPSWQNVEGMGLYTVASHPEVFGNMAVQAKASLLMRADSLKEASGRGYGVPMRSRDFVWGSSGVAGNNGMLLLQAYYLTGESAYKESAVSAMDYLLGLNPLRKSFVTGYGTRPALYPHHRISQSDGVSAPVPGMVVGGPQRENNEDKAYCVSYVTLYPATSYLDDECSYATNEVAINWNAPAAYLVGALQAMAEGHSATVQGTIKALPAPTAPAVYGKTRLVFTGKAIEVRQGKKRLGILGRSLSE